jgi:hypothetical protein
VTDLVWTKTADIKLRVPETSRNSQCACVQSLGPELKQEASILTTVLGSVPANSCCDTTHCRQRATHEEPLSVLRCLQTGEKPNFCDGRNSCRTSGHLQNKPEMDGGWCARLLLTRNVQAVDEVVEKRRCSVYMRGAYRVRPSKDDDTDEVLFRDGKHIRYGTRPCSQNRSRTGPRRHGMCWCQ